MKNLSIFLKILLITIPLVVLILLSAIVMRKNMQDVLFKSESVYLDTLYEINNNLLAADRDFYQAQIAFTRYSRIAGAEAGEVDDFNENAQQTIDKVNAAIDLARGNELLFKKTLSDGEDFETISYEFVDSYNRWKASYDVSAKSGDIEKQEQFFKDARGYLDRLQEITEEWAEKEGAVLTQSINTRINSITIGYLVIIIVVLVIVIFTSRSIAKGVKDTKDRLDIIATNDLTQEVPETKAKDEIGQMTRSFRSMQANLKEIISVLYKESDDLDSSVTTMRNATTETAQSMESINTAAGELATTATQTATDIETIANEMQELDGVMRSSVESTSALAGAGQEIGKVTKAGMDIVEELTQINNQCVNAFNSIFKGIENIEGSSNRISEASTLISSIANQTNLLSLNASIEAARAGEAGRGFAVVADEIRSLSEQSAESVQTINTLLEELHKNTNEAIAQSEMVKNYVEKQNSSVAQTKGSFSDITTTVEDVNSAVIDLKSINDQLAKGFGEISSLVESLSAASEENAATAEELSATSDIVRGNVLSLDDIQKRIDDAAAKLADIVKQFKV
ncbi:MAG: methyl-accepting chemotaxis protein [Lachnospiraceae bacterium]|nr:methyl-accepting chemotaxis protein [Lachnospiraceae bacterium]